MEMKLLSLTSTLVLYFYDEKLNHNNAQTTFPTIDMTMAPLCATAKVMKIGSTIFHSFNEYISNVANRGIATGSSWKPFQVQ